MLRRHRAELFSAEPGGRRQFENLLVSCTSIATSTPHPQRTSGTPAWVPDLRALTRLIQMTSQDQAAGARPRTATGTLLISG